MDTYLDDLREWLRAKGLNLSPSITGLRDGQSRAVDWATHADVPYLFINAPTGSGKTLMLGVIGSQLGKQWSYGVHTIRLQEQVAETFIDLPAMKGRANFACEIGMETHKQPDVTAADGICLTGQWCEWQGKAPDQADLTDNERYERHSGAMCGYYQMRHDALSSRYRTANYSFLLADS